MAATPLPTTTVHIPGTVNPLAHAATWGSAKLHQIVQSRQKATAQPKAPAQPKAKAQPKGKSGVPKSTTKGGIPKSGKSTSKTTTTTKTTTKAPEKPWYEQNPAQIHHMVEKSVQNQAKEEENAPRQRLGEIQAISQAGQAGLKANTTATTSALGGMNTAQEASAKTTENEDAEKAQQRIANLGTGPAETSPGVTNAEAQFLSSTGASGVSAAQNREQSESKYLASVEAAAQLRGQEQLGTYAGKIATEEGTENTKLAGIKAGEPGQISAEELKLLPEQTKLRLAAGELGVKQETAKTTKTNDETKNKITATNYTAKYTQTARANSIKET